MPNYGQQVGSAARIGGAAAVNPILAVPAFFNEASRSNWGSVQMADPYAQVKRQASQQLAGATPEQWKAFEAAIPGLPGPLQEWARQQLAGQQQTTATNAQGVPDYAALLQQANLATDPGAYNSLFNTIGGNVMSRGAQAAGQAQQGAAAQAASRGLANPSAFINASGQRAAQPFYNQMGDVEQGRAQALIQAAMKRFDFQYLINRAQQGDKDAEAQLKLKLQQLEQEQQKIDWAKEQSRPGSWDFAKAGIDIATTPGAGEFFTDIWSKLFGGGASSSGSASYEQPGYDWEG